MQRFKKGDTVVCIHDRADLGVLGKVGTVIETIAAYGFIVTFDAGPCYMDLDELSHTKQYYINRFKEAYAKV